MEYGYKTSDDVRLRDASMYDDTGEVPCPAPPAGLSPPPGFTCRKLIKRGVSKAPPAELVVGKVSDRHYLLSQPASILLYSGVVVPETAFAWVRRICRGCTMVPDAHTLDLLRRRVERDFSGAWRGGDADFGLLAGEDGVRIGVVLVLDRLIVARAYHFVAERLGLAETVLAEGPSSFAATPGAEISALPPELQSPSDRPDLWAEMLRDANLPTIESLSPSGDTP